MNDCLFCKIVSGEIPCHKIYEDENFLAFLDINPVNPGHTLVIPKKHSSQLLETDDQILQAIMPLVKQLSQKITTTLNSNGINILINCGTGAGQLIPHTHIHIIPRLINDNLKHWPSQKLSHEDFLRLVKLLKV
jgi:histidine triad (HIT) family protein